jgi:predicted transcriptional regulator
MNVNVNEMTIKEISELKGLTFQTINRYIKENNIKETKIIKRAKYYNVNEFDNIKKKKINKNINDEKIESILYEQIEYLKKQINEKDEQINRLTDYR